MIDNLLNLLADHEALGVSKNIDIAKGKYKLPVTVKEKIKQSKREKAWLKK